MTHTNRSSNPFFSPEMSNAVFSASGDALLWINAEDGAIMLVNPAACRVYGWPRETLAGMRLRDLAVEPEWTDRLLVERTTRVPLRYHRRGNGQHVPVEMQLDFSVGTDHDYCLVTVRDLSEQLAAQSHLQNTERMHQGIFGAAPYPILLMGSRHAITDANASALRLYGYDHAEICRLRIGDLLVEPGQVDDYRLGRKGGISPRWYRRRDGSRFLAEAMLSPMRAERGTRAIIVVRDVTEETRISEQLQASEERWRFALEAHDSGLIEWFPETDDFFVSRRFVEQLGYAEGELPARFESWEALLHADDLDRWHRSILAHLTREIEMIEVAVRLRNRDGDHRWIEVRAKAMTRDPAGRVLRLIGTARDVTDERERTLRERLQEEQLLHTARLVSMGEMATVMAHELNQPLAAIGNFTSAALRRMNGKIDDPDVFAALGNVTTLVERAGGIVRRIRDFTRKGHGQTEPVDINAVIKEIARLLEPQSQMLDVRITLALESGLFRLAADRLQLGQLILNLAKNGLEAMSETSGPRQLILRSLRHSKREVEIRVEDRGCGLPEQMAHDVITPFFTTKPDGLGMGLVICRTIMENHGGRLWATPNQPRGTLFHIVLPIAPHE